ncbi:MAG: PAS domain-containing sensor histidine kinase [Cytophagales bacterium]|nr:PAS domain-containing sensor histidine kinase [Cytophaga sp.]
MSFPLNDEELRLAALKSYFILNSEEEKELNDLTQIAASLCQTPHAYVTLLDNEKVRFKASYGEELTELDSEISFTKHTILQDGVFEVENTIADPRFVNHPCVNKKPYLRYFCGTALIDSSGFKLGVFCVADIIPRTLTDIQKNALVLLSKQVINNFELRRREKNLEKERLMLEEIIKERTAEITDINYTLRQIIDLVPHPIFVKDKEGNYLLANKAQGRLYDVEPEALLGKNDRSFVFNTTDYTIIKESDQNVIRTKETIVIPKQDITLHETQYLLYTSKVPLLNIASGELRILGVSIDHFEFQKLENEKENSRQAFEKLIELSPDAIFIQSTEGKLLFSNPAGLKLLSATDEKQLVGMSVMDFIHQDSKEEVEQRMASSDDVKRKVSEQKAIRLDGSLVDIEVVAVSFIFNGEPAEQVIARDVSDQIVAREALYKSREEFRTLADNSTDIISRINRELRFTYINKAITNTTHQPPGFYIGKTPREAGFTKELYTSIGQLIKKVIQTGKSTSGYFENPQQESGFRYAYITIVPEYNQDGELVSVLKTIRDVSEIKNNELKLIQAGKDLDHFVYSASHELRAPLKSILGLTGIAMVDIQQNIYTDQVEYLRRIKKSVLRLDETVKDIIEYSRNTRLDIQKEHITFNELIDTILIDLSALQHAGAIEIIKNIQDERPFYSDFRRIRIVLTNIISNSIKYYDPSKHAPRIEIIVQTFDDHCQIVVSDNGIGISKEYLDRIFNMFFRATDRNEGDGLGLYIVQEILTKLEAQITVDSTLGEQTSFTIIIPNLAD